MLRPLRAFILAIAAVACAASTAAHAQTGVYAQFTGTAPSFTSSDWLYGGTFGLYNDRYHIAPVHLGLDLRGTTVFHGNNSLVGGLAGPRLSIVPHVVPFKVYGEALVGVAVVDYAGNNGTHLQYQINGGLEYTVLPHVDWRVAEVSYSGFSGGTGGLDNPVGVSTGIVLRLR